MVEVTEILDDEPTTTTTTTTETPTASASQERHLDANEIESLIQNKDLALRPSVKAHLTSLVQKIRRDANALKRMEDSRLKLQQEQQEKEEEEEKVVVEEVETPPTPQATAQVPAPAPPSTTTRYYKNIDKFLFDAGSYNSPTVSIYIQNLTNINQLPKENITCQFTSTSFDLTINNFNNTNLRLIKDNLEHEINPDKSKFIIKANKIIIKLAKIKNDYGYESWTNLTSKKTALETKNSNQNKKKDPSASIMDLMKEMYDSGDDNMKKMIGETMLKQREGKLGDGPGGMGDMGMDL